MGTTGAEADQSGAAGGAYQFFERKESIKSRLQYKQNPAACGGTLGSELFTRDETLLLADE